MSNKAKNFGIYEVDFINVLQAAGFRQSDDHPSIFELSIPNQGALAKVEFDFQEPKKSKIVLTPKIRVEHKGVLSFEKEENIVTLVCLADLLKKGYSPTDLHLEKTWKLGHKDKGRLDILIYESGTGGKLDKSWAMIECKTWGEFIGAENDMRQDGAQLFSYWIQDRHAKYLYLYAASFHDGSIEAKSDYVPIDQLDSKATNLEELHASWDTTFFQDGIFHKDAMAYDSTSRLLRKSDLKTLDQETGTGIFNAFAEILRRHTISDKGNAFNKIFNLFVCKIIDEDQSRDSDVLNFQVRGSENSKNLLDSLDILYRLGLEKYLGIQVNPEYVSSSQNFGFIDVFDNASYAENFQIVREVVKLLQPYKLKYSSKQQHLGDFFELLLNTGVKQESGQFFTPVPLTRFAVKSLPLDEIVQSCLSAGGDRLFPKIIDYACGSGHFITEAIEEVQSKIDQIDVNSIVSSMDRTKFQSSRDNFQWTAQNVFGIEKDYRLAKVTKIATFLNGDGEANILHADGLDSFSKSRTYKGILKNDPNNLSKENPVFDMLVANPPYSVPNFLAGGEATEESFNLLKFMNLKGSEIECLFIERTAQLLRPGGVAAIVLPSGIFSNQRGVYNEARKLLLRNFKIRAVLNLGKNAFMATQISTSILFLQKRQASEWEEAKFAISNTGAELTKEEDIQDAYRLLLSSEKTLVSSMGENQEEKNFLGYEFSTRRGKEGIKVYERSSLFATDKALREIEDSKLVGKVHHLADLVRASFAEADVQKILDEEAALLPQMPLEIQHELSPIHSTSKVVVSSTLLEFEGEGLRINCDVDSASAAARLDFNGLKCAVVTFGELLEGGSLVIDSGSRPVGGVGRIRTGILSLGGEHVDELNGRLDLTKRKLVPEEFFKQNSSIKAHVVVGDILICKDGARSGKVAYVHAQDLQEPAMVNEHLFKIRMLQPSSPVVSSKYLFYYWLSSEGRAELETAVAGSAQGGISLERLKKTRIPLPDFEEQLKLSQAFEDSKETQGFSITLFLSPP